MQYSVRMTHMGAHEDNGTDSRKLGGEEKAQLLDGIVKSSITKVFH